MGCDGAHSFVRKHAGIDFPGTTYDKLSRIGHVTLSESMSASETGELELPGLERLRLGFTRTPRGTFSFMSFKPGVHTVATVEEGQSSVDLSMPLLGDASTRLASKLLVRS